MEKTVNVKVKRPVLRHKMYKSGRNWVIAGVVGASTMMLTMTANADATINNNQTSASNTVNTASVASGGNAVAATAQPVAVKPNASQSDNIKPNSSVPNSTTSGASSVATANNNGEKQNYGLKENSDSATKTDSIKPNNAEKANSSQQSVASQATPAINQAVSSTLVTNGDKATATVTMNTPKISNGFQQVKLTNDYSQMAKHVDFQKAMVLQNDVVNTANYTVTNDPDKKVVTATSTNPQQQSDGGTISLVIGFKIHDDVKDGTQLINNGSGTLNNQTVPTNTAQIVTFTQNPTKHWIENNQVVDGSTYVNDDVVTSKVEMNLPDPDQLADKLTNVTVTDNYSDFANKVDLTGYRVLENNVDVTDQYTLVSNSNGILTVTRKDPSTTPGGFVDLIATFKVHDDVPSGTRFVNSGSGQLDNHTVSTNQAQIVTYNPSTAKHWVEGSQIVDDKTYIDGDNVHAQIEMSLPDPNKLAKPLTHVSVTGNWSQYRDYVTYETAHVYENGQDVTDQYNIVNENNVVTATRKNPGEAPTGSVKLVVDFKTKNDLPNGTKLYSTGSGQLNDRTVPTSTVKVLTYLQSTDKHWVEGSQDVDGKTYVDGDQIHGRVTMSLPDPDELAKPLNYVSITDDYTNFADKVKYDGSHVFENGNDVTDQYNITVANNKVTATRKDASKAPKGKVDLLVDWTINDNVASGTKMTNSGSGTINTQTVNTPNRDIFVYYQTVNKHWVDQNVVVDGKTYINDDLVHAEVDMSIPNANSLAKQLNDIELIDDYNNFADKVTPQSITVTEDGKDVTDQYTITNQNGQINATRKTPGNITASVAQLNITWKVNDDVASGTRFHNTGYGILNQHSVKTNQVDIVTYKQSTDKHWTEGSQTVDGKIYMDNDEVHTDVTMSLPQPDQLAKKLSKVVVTDNYTRFQDKVDYLSASVTENGTDVTNQYTITNSNGIVTATRNEPATTPAGIVDLHVNFKIHSNVPSGTDLVNGGSGQINDSTVNTPDRTIHTYKQTTDKNWIENNTNVNGKIYIDNDTAHAQITTTLPDPSQLAKPLSKLAIVDDYSNFSKYADVKSVQIEENGKNVTNQYSISVNSANGTITATRKDASSQPGGNATMLVEYLIHADTPSGTQLVNKGSVTLNDETVPTPTPSVTTYKPTTDKHWVEGTQNVDGMTYIDGDKVTGRVSMSLPDPSQLAKKLTNVSISDDFTRFKNDVDYVSAKVFENNQDVTEQYTITNTNGIVTATRKDPSTTPGGNVVLEVVWNTHKDLANNTQLVNSGSGTIDNETVPTPNRTIVTYKQTTDKHWMNGDQVVDGKTFIDGDQVNGQVTMSLPDPSKLAHQLSNLSITDDYSQFADKVIYQSAKVYENGTDVTNLYSIEVGNGKVTATRKDASSAPSGQVMLDVKWNINTDVASGTQLVNGGSGTINSETVEVPNRTIVTYKQNTDKHWINSKGQVVDGKVTINGDNVTARVDMTLPSREDMGGSFNKIQLIDDFSKFADKVTLKDIHVYENGKDVTDQYNITVENNHVIATRKNPNGIDNSRAATKASLAVSGTGSGLTQSLLSMPSGETGVNFTNGANGGKQYQANLVSLVIHYQVNDDVPSGTKLENYGAGIINNETVATNHPFITTWKPEAVKDVVISVDNQKSLNHSNIALNQKFSYKLTGSKLPQNMEDPLTQYGFKDDYDQVHDQYNGQYSVLLDQDVTLSDGTVLKKGTDVKKYTTQTIDSTKGAVDIEFDKDFLSSIDFDKGGFGASVYLAMKRIKAGDVYNKYTNVINGKDYVSNTVETHTDEPKAPTKQQQPTVPSAPTTELSPTQALIETPTKNEQQAKLPQTGNQENNEATIGLAMIALIDALTLVKKKKQLL